MARNHAGFNNLLLLRKCLSVLYTILLLVTVVLVQFESNTSVDAFCSTPQIPSRQNSAMSHDYSTSTLFLLRPDWMRRAGRIEQKRKERRKMFESLRKRQDELGIQRTIARTTDRWKKMTPTKYIVITPKSPQNGTIVQSDGDCNGLAVYPFVPEDEVEARDESNILDWLEHGEIVEAVRAKKVTDDSVPPPSTAVMAAAMIYNVPSKIQSEILWIEHDKGGWSPTIVDGVTRLIPINNAADRRRS